MLKRFKSAVIEAAESKFEIRLITIASLVAGQAVVFMAYMAACLSGLIEW